MEIKNEYLPVPSQRRSGEKNLGITYVVCHDTANDGATAEDNVAWYIKSANDMQASAHTFVDDLGAIECVPLNEKAWHVRYNAGIAPNIEGNFANDHAIGVELCYSTEGKFDSLKAYQNYCAYIAGLCEKYSLDTSKLVQHAQLDPTRRTDPINALSKIGKTWEQFLQDVGAIITSASQTQKNSMEENTAAPVETPAATGAVKWVNFLGSDKSRITYFVEQKTLQNDGETHDFATAEDALNGNTSDSFVFWDGVPVGVGKK